MKIRTSVAGNAAILTVEGRMDAESCGEFEAACTRALAGGARHIVADLSSLAYISSAGVGTFVKIARHLQRSNGEIVLSSLHGLALHVFELTHIITIFRVFESPEAAAASLT